MEASLSIEGVICLMLLRQAVLKARVKKRKPRGRSGAQPTVMKAIGWSFGDSVKHELHICSPAYVLISR